MNNEMSVKRILDIVMSDYLRKLYTFCLRETRNHADAEDLCQDILTEIVYSARNLRHPGALSGWVWAAEMASGIFDRRIVEKDKP